MNDIYFSKCVLIKYGEVGGLNLEQRVEVILNFSNKVDVSHKERFRSYRENRIGILAAKR
jgi:hypothetical protein